MKILFVCRGNVGRSQMAEALYKIYGDKTNEVSSAGTKLSGPEEPIMNLPLAFNVVDVIKEEGLDISTAVRNQVTPDMADEADKIILVVDDADPIPEYLKNNAKVTQWNVPDPKGTSLERHREIKDQIKELIKSLVV